LIHLPNTWGPGQLFAYSGMEGPTCASSPMVAHTLAERIGLRVYFDPPVEIWCQARLPDDPTRKYPRCQPHYEIICGDAIRLKATFTDGETVGIAWAPVSQDVFAGYTAQRIAPHWSVGPEAGRPLILPALVGGVVAKPPLDPERWCGQQRAAWPRECGVFEVRYRDD